MHITSTQCCALREIFNLHTDKDAKAAMISFCEKITQYDYNTPKQMHRKAVWGMYLFTGEVARTDGTTPNEGFNYATGFAAFIRRNKLGKVSGSYKALNHVNHPTHIVRAWIWVPDTTRLNAWWKKNQPSTATVETTVPTPAVPGVGRGIPPNGVPPR